MKKGESQARTVQIEVVRFPDEEYTTYFVGDRINGSRKTIVDFLPFIADSNYLTQIAKSTDSVRYTHKEGARVEAYSKGCQGVIAITGNARQIVSTVSDLGNQLVSEHVAIRKIKSNEEERYKR